MKIIVRYILNISFIRVFLLIKKNKRYIILNDSFLQQIDLLNFIKFKTNLNLSFFNL